MIRKNMETTTRARCPSCRREFLWRGNPHRPFCSLTCRLIDLGVWLDEGYRIPGKTMSDEATLDERVSHEGG